ncbi:xylosidase/arabinosidase [Rhizobacter sp. SG703]|uniref:xylosidase/arabinosidase n=1 Tax=Rhizobacter sp. SG703 TaxID=2587140 RepID=UPI0014476FD6|nr:xylosidase/arabinosidase [Rhizobacter sp. SG703]NKI95223.1 hypothetical protein [Rhizobacter sp. SG703]
MNILQRWRAVAASVILAAPLMTPAQAQTVDSSTLVGKVLVGYQAWFRCPGDGSPGNGWSHWSNGAPSAGTLAIDAYPDLGGLPQASLCTVPGMTVQGQPARLFSSYPKETADTHFQWMRSYGIDGALLQRFVSDIPWLRSEKDVVLQNLRNAAERYGRTFAIEYDLSMDYTQVSDDALMAKLQEDWQHLANELKLTASPAYLKQGGKPIVSLWGLGFGDANHVNRPALGQRIVDWFKTQAQVTVMGGVPGGWKVGGRSSSADPGWAAVYASLDVVQPWAVGSFGDAAGADNWKAQVLQPDLAQARANKQLYLPVIFPGFSWHNLMKNAPQNQIPRDGGRFLWRQAFNARDAGAVAVKIAMFDEVNESTAIFKVASKRSAAPDQGYWLTLDADGRDLPSDWYLRLAYEVARVYSGQVANGATMPANPGPGSTTEPPAPPPPPPVSGCGVVPANTLLPVNRPLNSCDGRFQLWMQSDGNLVLYQGNQPLWSSGTAGKAVGKIAMQGDGNLVIYDPANRPFWASNTSGHPGAHLTLQNDGNLVVYLGSQALWASGSCCH